MADHRAELAQIVYRVNSPMYGDYDTHEETADAILAAGWRPPLPDSETEPTGVSLIAAERRRQVDEEGWTNDHDSEHRSGVMAAAAACYATPPHERQMETFNKNRYDIDARCRLVTQPKGWPWAAYFWKPCPDDRVRELIKAGALIAAEIDRLRSEADRG